MHHCKIPNIKQTHLFAQGVINTNIKHKYQRQISNKLNIFAQGVIMNYQISNTNIKKNLIFLHREWSWRLNGRITGRTPTLRYFNRKCTLFKSFSFNFLSWMTTKKKYCFSDAFLECPHFKGMICVLFQDTLSKSLESATTARYYEQTWNLDKMYHRK